MSLQDVQLTPAARMRIMIDFDGVIRDDSSGFQGGELRDEVPVAGAFASLMKLHLEKYELVIFTTRAIDPDLECGVNEWMCKWQKKLGLEFPFRITCTKEAARMYIDDRAVRFTNWPDMEKLLR